MKLGTKVTVTSNSMGDSIVVLTPDEDHPLLKIGDQKFEFVMKNADITVREGGYIAMKVDGKFLIEGCSFTKVESGS